jgi:DNA-binding HxlR family transcriptional regulator
VTRTPLGDVACSIARATDLFADAWTALIMRDVLTGVTRFDDLAHDLGISRKVLAARLARLVREDVLVREQYQERPPREDYRATEKGKDLYPVLLALMNWGDRWYSVQRSASPRPPPHLRPRHHRRTLWVPTTCATWPDAPLPLNARLRTCQGVG